MSRIVVRYGDLNVEYEGSDDFIKDGLLGLLTEVAAVAATGVAGPNGSTSVSHANGPALDFSVKTISSKLGNSKGADLARSAAVFLTLVQKRETFSQGELLTAMKSATGLYKQSTHGKNLGSIILSLIGSGLLVETSTGAYSLAEAHRGQFENMLGIA